MKAKKLSVSAYHQHNNKCAQVSNAMQRPGKLEGAIQYIAQHKTSDTVACLQIHFGPWPGVLSIIFNALQLGSAAFPAAQPALPGAVRGSLPCMPSDIDKISQPSNACQQTCSDTCTPGHRIDSCPGGL